MLQYYELGCLLCCVFSGLRNFTKKIQLKLATTTNEYEKTVTLIIKVAATRYIVAKH